MQVAVATAAAADPSATDPSPFLSIRMPSPSSSSSSTTTTTAAAEDELERMLKEAERLAQQMRAAAIASQAHFIDPDDMTTSAAASHPALHGAVAASTDVPVLAARFQDNHTMLHLSSSKLHFDKNMDHHEEAEEQKDIMEDDDDDVAVAPHWLQQPPPSLPPPPRYPPFPRASESTADTGQSAPVSTVQIPPHPPSVDEDALSLPSNIHVVGYGTNSAGQPYGTTPSSDHETNNNHHHHHHHTLLTHDEMEAAIRATQDMAKALQALGAVHTYTASTNTPMNYDHPQEVNQPREQQLEEEEKMASPATFITVQDKTYGEMSGLVGVPVSTQNSETSKLPTPPSPLRPKQPVATAAAAAANPVPTVTVSVGKPTSKSANTQSLATASPPPPPAPSITKKASQNLLPQEGDDDYVPLKDYSFKPASFAPDDSVTWEQVDTAREDDEDFVPLKDYSHATAAAASSSSTPFLPKSGPHATVAHVITPNARQRLAKKRKRQRRRQRRIVAAVTLVLAVIAAIYYYYVGIHPPSFTKTKRTTTNQNNHGTASTTSTTRTTTISEPISTVQEPSPSTEPIVVHPFVWQPTTPGDDDDDDDYILFSDLNNEYDHGDSQTNKGKNAKGRYKDRDEEEGEGLSKTFVAIEVDPAHAWNPLHWLKRGGSQESTATERVDALLQAMFH